MRAGERHSSHRPELPSLFKIVRPYCGRRDANPLKIAGPQLGVNYLNLVHSREDVELTCGTVLSLKRDVSGNQGAPL
jgi:hypothetical protein